MQGQELARRRPQQGISRFRVDFGTFVRRIFVEGAFGEAPPWRPTASFGVRTEADLFMEAFMGWVGAFFMGKGPFGARA